MIGPAVTAGLVALVLVAAGAVVPGLPAILVRLLPAALLAVALPLRTPEPERVGEGVIGLLPGLPVLQQSIYPAFVKSKRNARDEIMCLA